MSNLNPDQVLHFEITEFPQHLLIPDIKNTVKLRLTNRSPQNEAFKIALKGENLEVTTEADFFNKQLDLESSQNKDIILDLQPTETGYGKLSISIYWMKKVEQIVDIEKIRDFIKKPQKDNLFSKFLFEKLKPVSELNRKQFLEDAPKQKIKKLEKNLEEFIEQGGSIESKEYTHKLIEIIRSCIFQEKFEEALDSIKKIVDQSKKNEIFNIAIRIIADLDLVYANKELNKLPDDMLKNRLLKIIAIDRIKDNPDSAIAISSNISDDLFKNKTLIEIIKRLNLINPEEALQKLKHIKSIDLKLQFLFNIAHQFVKESKIDQSIEVLDQIYEIITQNLNEKYIDYLTIVILLTAEIKNPKKAVDLINKINNKDIKNKLNNELFDILFEIVKEKKLITEPVQIISQYYHLNIYNRDNLQVLKEYVKANGNISSTLLMKEKDISPVLLSLFKHSFSIYPIFERLLTDLKYNSKKSIGYFIFPLENNVDEMEYSILLKCLNTLMNNSYLKELKNEKIIYNIDFIPYLGIPTVIVGAEKEIRIKILKKLSPLENSVNLRHNDLLFLEGKIIDNLNAVFSNSNMNLINLILSYEFINDYDILKRLIELLAN